MDIYDINTRYRDYMSERYYRLASMLAEKTGLDLPHALNFFYHSDTYYSMLDSDMGQHMIDTREVSDEELLRYLMIDFHRWKYSPELHIVLAEPQIPQNTGNIARTCAVTGAVLHLIKPYGFEISDKNLKRAGLDYWDKLLIYEYDSLEDFMQQHEEDLIYYFTTKAQKCHSDAEYPQNQDIYLMFGREDAGLPEELLVQHPETAVRIPMLPTLRSLNLSNSVAIAAYEVLRQRGYPYMSWQGNLTKYEWE